jgi:plastocyanin
MREKRSMGRFLVVALSAQLLLAGCRGEDRGAMEPTPSRARSEEPAEEPKADVVVAATASARFEPSEVRAAAGTITVALTSKGGPHTFTVDLDPEPDTVAASYVPGKTGFGEIELAPGTYTFYCAVLDHRELGMEGTLTVS